MRLLSSSTSTDRPPFTLYRISYFLPCLLMRTSSHRFTMKEPPRSRAASCAASASSPATTASSAASASKVYPFLLLSLCDKFFSGIVLWLFFRLFAVCIVSRERCEHPLPQDASRTRLLRGPPYFQSLHVIQRSWWCYFLGGRVGVDGDRFAAPSSPGSFQHLPRTSFAREALQGSHRFLYLPSLYPPLLPPLPHLLFLLFLFSFPLSFLMFRLIGFIWELLRLRIYNIRRGPQSSALVCEGVETAPYQLLRVCSPYVRCFR